jgi:hypothetical protein
MLWESNEERARLACRLAKRQASQMSLRALLLALGLLLSTPASPAPICFTRAGDTVHCDAKDAMPIGWRLPPDEAARREMNQPHPSSSDILKVVAVLVLFFALIALLPEFDGARDQDWDTQEKRDPDQSK